TRQRAESGLPVRANCPLARPRGKRRSAERTGAATRPRTNTAGGQVATHVTRRGARLAAPPAPRPPRRFLPPRYRGKEKPARSVAWRSGAAVAWRDTRAGPGEAPVSATV